jgi:hypothetical protein
MTVGAGTCLIYAGRPTAGDGLVIEYSMDSIGEAFLYGEYVIDRNLVG